MRKPQGYRQTLAEGCFVLLVLLLPYWQSLFLAGISGIFSVLLWSSLLMFVVGRSPEAYRAITAGLRALPLSWVAPILDRRDRWVSAVYCSIPDGPSLAPLFQRPPPLFS